MTMAIDIKKYVNITSGVGGASQVATRQFIGCVFSPSELIDPAIPVTFESANAVGLHFGNDSEEYLRATSYFAFVSPTIRVPQAIMFGRYVLLDSPGRIFGGDLTTSLTEFQAVTAGELTISFGGTAVTVSGIDLSTATSLSDVASLIQVALRANGNVNLLTCTVEFDAVNNRFAFEASPSGFTIGSVSVSFTALSNLLGWLSTDGAIVTSGSLAKTPLESVQALYGETNNFGSFTFTESSVLTIGATEEIAAWNAALNVIFMFHVAIGESEYAAGWQDDLDGYAGCAITYDIIADEYHVMLPMAIQAATDYTQRNGVMSYMYRQLSSLSPSVDTDALAYQLDAANVNYIGQTQTAGQKKSIYQNGVLQGGATDPRAMNVFANEQWLKDYIRSEIFNLQLTLPQVSAGSSGLAQLSSVVNSSAQLGLFNGVITTGKTFTETQKLFITQLSGDEDVWKVVQSAGYWADVVIRSEVNNDIQTYVADYTLIYSKNDAVQSVNG